MAKTKQGKHDVDAYTIKGTNKMVRGKRLPRPSRALDRCRRALASRVSKIYALTCVDAVHQVGDCVLMRPADADKPPYVARVERLESDGRGGVRVRVRWYYRPAEAKGGRRPFHGAKELFLSDHFDTQSAHTIEGKCVVHSFKNYTKLDNVGPEDFYCRFDYKAATGAFTPDRVAVYCAFPFLTFVLCNVGSLVLSHGMVVCM